MRGRAVLGFRVRAGAQVARLGEPRAGDDAAVTALAFGPMGNLLAAGHANGDVAFWELKRAGWECVRALREAHVTAVSAAAFVAGGGAAVATADTRGRVVLHNVSAYLSLTALLAGAPTAACAQMLTVLRCPTE